MSSKETVISGVDRLDQLLTGLQVGDNVVWLDDSGSLAWHFCLRFLQQSRDEKSPIIYINADRPLKSLSDKLGDLVDYPELTVLDCFTAGKGESSPVFLDFYQYAERLPARFVLVEAPEKTDTLKNRLNETLAGLQGSVRLVFDSMTGLQELWGGEDRLASFYRHTCPRLYELNTIAYWIMEKMAHSSMLKAQIGQLAQVMIELSIKRGTTYLSILKAEGRPRVELQESHPYLAKDRDIHFDGLRRHAGGFDLGSRLKELRTKKGISQTELAKRVGVTPSTISQVESNLIYPSLPALIKMADVLKIDVCAFFQVDFSAKPRSLFTDKDAIKTRIEGISEEVMTAWRLTPIDFEGRAEPFLLEIAPNQTLSNHFFYHKGEEVGYLLSGRLDMKMEGKVQEIEPGRTIYLTTQTPGGWKNPGPEPARLFWLVIN